MLWWQSLILSLVQGLTEFLPVSSSGHLLLLPKLFSWPDQGLAFDATVHLGTAFAAIMYFRRDIANILIGIRHKGSPQRRLAMLIAISMIPAVAVGLFFEQFFASTARSVFLVAVNLVFWGIVLIVAEYVANHAKAQGMAERLTPLKAFVIGCAQALALLPGTSRSGITISAGIFAGLNKVEAVRFSFLMSIPVILGAGSQNFLQLLTGSADELISIPAIFIALFGAFLSGWFAIAVLLRFLEKRGLIVFAIYRFFIAGLLFLFVV